MKAHLIIPLIASLVHVSMADEVACWAPDGVTMADNSTYVPCNKLGIEQEGVYSSCCQLDGDPDERDLCTTTGLCLLRGVLSRGYCTDRNWDSPACVNVCTEDENGDASNSTSEMTSCGDSTYCCGSNNLQCCGTDRAITIPTQASVIRTETRESSTFRNVTIALAVVLGVVALVAAGVIIWLLQKNKGLRRQVDEKTQAYETLSSEHAQAQSHRATYVSGRDDRSTTVTSPGISEYGYPKTPWSMHAPPPMHPEPSRLSEVQGEPRYMELDATESRPPSRAPGSPSGHA
jgi:nitrate reductase NapE component